MKEIIINDDENKEIISVLENGILVEEYEENENSKIIEGNIYCGIVRNILPGMQSAFVDIGEGKNAFIHIKDILPKVSNETGNKEEKFESYNISDYIKEGKPILVQVKKDEENLKGARVSKHISLTGKYVVVMPNVEFVTVSKKIEDEEERNRIKNIAKSILEEENTKSEKYGLILRTATKTASKEELKCDIKNLIEIWNKILEKYDRAKEKGKPSKICEAKDLLTKTIIDITSNGDCEIYVNTEKLLERVNKIISNMTTSEIKIELVKNDLINMYDLNEQIEKCQERKVWLKCGGFITIDKTEALTAIDVNSGKYVGKRGNSKDTTLSKVNFEASIEIAKQIKLRNISGIIIIDYIDMEKNEDRENIIKLLNEEIKKDRSKIQLVGFTKLDLFEITRKKL